MSEGAAAAQRPPAAPPGEGGTVVLVLNAGSSSVKLALFPADCGDEPIMRGLVERIGSPEARAELRVGDGPNEALTPPERAGASHEAALGWLLPLIAERAARPVAVGHRIVHGGADFTEPARLDEKAMAALDRLTPLARTHQPHGLAAARAASKLWPETPQVAAFDTAFHATIPEAARTLALPETVRKAGVRRYGFHGLSYAWIASRLPDLLAEGAGGRVIVAHLGNGASLCGMVGGESRATTMSFTPLDGLVMGERPGATDPGAVLFMMEELGMDAAAIRDALFKESGLKGLSGLSNDMRTLVASDDPSARLAIEVYVRRAVREIGATAAEIGGLDALIFTAGVGENSAEIRSRIVSGCRWLGAELDEDRNRNPPGMISTDGSAVTVWVEPTSEEATIARAVRATLAA